MARNPNERKANWVDTRIGQTVRDVRKSLSMSQEQLASEIGLTFQQVQKYEKGMNRISVSKLFDIAVALGKKPGFFYDGLTAEVGLAGMAEDGAAYTHDFFATSEGAEILRTFPTLTQQQQRAVLELIRSFTSG